MRSSSYPDRPDVIQASLLVSNRAHVRRIRLFREELDGLRLGSPSGPSRVPGMFVARNSLSNLLENLLVFACRPSVRFATASKISHPAVSRLPWSSAACPHIPPSRSARCHLGAPAGPRCFRVRLANSFDQGLARRRGSEPIGMAVLRVSSIVLPAAGGIAGNCQVSLAFFLT